MVRARADLPNTSAVAGSKNPLFQYDVRKSAKHENINMRTTCFISI
jgi:hypothetical protein